MAITAVSIDEAFAQGSSWSQMLSIAKFHEGQIGQKLRSTRDAAAAMPDWKARKAKQELDTATRTHLEYVSHFKQLASSMRAAADEVPPNEDR